MNEAQLQAYLHEHIPLTAAMDVEVREAAAHRVVLRAPLAPNINHRETVFGGSACAVAIVSAWSLLHLRLAPRGTASRLVIQANTMRYEMPIAGPFDGICEYDDELAWERFAHLLERRGKARIGVAAVLEYDGRVAGRFAGDFVALSD